MQASIVAVVILSVIILVLLPLLLTRIILRCFIGRCPSTATMQGKVIIVTGANSGIGFEISKNLAARGGRVILACRNEDRGIAARDRIISETGNVNVVFKKLDLSSLISVRRFAEDMYATEEYLHVLVNNAGAYGLEERYTKDGIVEPMQVNYFGPFLLTLLLIPLLKKSQPSRVINVTSLLHYFARLDLKYINEERRYCSMFGYANAKLCNIIFTLELSKRLKDSGVVANAVHPGAMYTGVAKNMMFFTKILFKICCWICYRSAAEGAQTLIYLCVTEDCAKESGHFYVDCKKWYISWKAFEEGLASDLWQISEELVNFKMNMNSLNLVILQ